jgi:hypothetical protein
VDIAYDAKLKRFCLSGDQLVEVFKQDDADHYTSLGKTELNRYFVAVPGHGTKQAEGRVYESIS